MDSQNKVREYSLPLILGVIAALVVSNLCPGIYQRIVYTPFIAGKIDFHWLIDDVFMVLFFASAGVEIVISLSPGGVLNPIKRAITPLMATAGGVLGPIGVFFILNYFIGRPEWSNGWGICTATDIALAWLVAKLIFGKKHPAVSFLLLLAVADDGIGLVIIAVFYPTPGQPIRLQFLLLAAAGMGVAYIFKRLHLKSFWPYITIGGVLAWAGFYLTGVSPSLSLVMIVPFLPRTAAEVGSETAQKKGENEELPTLMKFEKTVAPVVDYGLFFFGFSNAGVMFSNISNLTFIVMLSLIVGKTIGISLFAYIFGEVLGFGLPRGMRHRDIFVTGIVGGTGLTVALFMTQVAYTNIALQGAAKMGALLSVLSVLPALIVAKILGINRKG